jgi:hypothetical protein
MGRSIGNAGRAGIQGPKHDMRFPRTRVIITWREHVSEDSETRKNRFQLDQKMIAGCAVRASISDHANSQGGIFRDFLFPRIPARVCWFSSLAAGINPVLDLSVTEARLCRVAVKTTLQKLARKLKRDAHSLAIFVNRFDISGYLTV